MVVDDTRATTVKTRISGSCSQSVTQQIVRIDRETIEPISKEIEDKIIAQMEKAIPLHDAVILSDYNIGVLTDNVIKSAIELCKKLASYTDQINLHIVNFTPIQEDAIPCNSLLREFIGGSCFYDV
jgi:bifunctional ADP-heptose synthase (sugar kinase/adenylyltransferase)